MFQAQTDRVIPKLMATQHPDNASVPFWSDKPFITTNAEVEEIYQSFFTLGCDEYMWDWEGKFADEGMIEKLVSNFYESFAKEQIGRDHFITLRIPNIWEEKTFKLARAYMSVLSAGEFTKSYEMFSPPVFELILPMTRSADQLLHIQRTFQKTAKVHESIFGDTNFGEGYIHMIPLFESVEDLYGCASIMEDFLSGHREHFKFLPPYLRMFIARSDPALNAGFVPSVLAMRIAFREAYRIQDKYEIPIHPIVGTGSLPFRGGINPENIEMCLPQYQGAQTITIQSAFRYDYPIDEVKKALSFMKKTLEKPQTLSFPDEEMSRLKELVQLFKSTYVPTLEAFAPMINAMAKYIPSRRERVQHIGLFGYSRGVGKVQLPRAISFTGACYSLGVPPEFIGTGRALKKAKEIGYMPDIEKHFSTLRHELKHAGKYLNRENLEEFAKKESWAKDIMEDVRLCEEILEIELGPQKESHLLHRNLTSNMRLKMATGVSFDDDLVEAAQMRKSLG